MLRVHNDGTAECGIYPYEIAKAKATQLSRQASASTSMRYRAQAVGAGRHHNQDCFWPEPDQGAVVANVG
jgi:ATP-dependent Clp protease adapter protein ClpS